VKSELLEIDKFLSRSLNEGFSGGENVMRFSNGNVRAKISHSDETDSGLDIDALRIVANGVNKLKATKRNSITHYQRLLHRS
jgi:Fe-S cluster assembly ATP-binding protein